MAFKLPNVTGFVAPFGASTAKEFSTAAAGAAGNILGGLAPAQSQGFQGYAQGLAGLGNAYASNYGAYAAGLGNVAQSQANDANNQYGSRAMAEAARQTALGNLGSAALGNWGSAANSAMSAWAQNQMAYNKSLSEMQQANQQSLSNYGVSRNQALGGLAGAYAQGGGQLGAASAVGDVSATFGDGGFNASGGFDASGNPSQIASGSFGGPGGGFFGSLTRTSDGSAVPAIANQTFGGLDRTRQDLMAGDITAALMRDADLGRMQLDTQHFSSRGMPSEMLDQTLGGLLTMSREGYDESGRGMDQFYNSLTEAEAARETPDYSTVLGGLASGFLHSGDQITGLRGDMGAGYENFRGDMGSMFNSDPVADMDTNRRLQLMQQQYAEEDQRRRRATEAKAGRVFPAASAPAGFTPSPITPRGGTFNPFA